MSTENFLYWGVIVALFLFIAALITARELFENYLEQRQKRKRNADSLRTP